MNAEPETLTPPTPAHPPAGSPSRRAFLGGLAGIGALGLGAIAAGPPARGAGFRLATFAVDVTVPIGHPLMGGGIAPAARVADPLELRGVVLLGPDRPIVLAAIDWCEIRNDAYARWVEALAEAAGTTPDRVLFSAVHQHDAPIADLRAERLLRDHGGLATIVDLDFHEQAVARSAAAVRRALDGARPVSHVGVGAAEVERIGSNRRYLTPEGRPSFARMSTTRDPQAREQPEGTVDPTLRTLSFWDGDEPVAALSTYSTHPMSTYGQGAVSADFVGLARRRRQGLQPGVFQVYASGCSGNVTAGKYNDGAPEVRAALADRLAAAMAAAWEQTRRTPLESAELRTTSLRLEPRDGPGFTRADLEQKLRDGPRPFDRCLAALGLSWRERAVAGATIPVSSLDLGAVRWLLLPAESYVEYQLLARSVRPEIPVLVAGYGECAPGYIPTDRAVAEGDSNLTDWCWVGPGAEAAMAAAIRRVLA